MAEQFDPMRVLAALGSGGVRFVLAGDLASMAHDAAQDADRLEIFVQPGEENLDRLGAALVAVGAEQDAEASEEHRAVFASPLGRIECVELPGEQAWASVEARATSMDLGAGVTARVAALEDVATQRLIDEDPVGAARVAFMSSDAAVQVIEEGDEYGPDPEPNGRFVSPVRRVWRAFEDIDRFLTDVTEGKVRTKDR